MSDEESKVETPVETEKPVETPVETPAEAETKVENEFENIDTGDEAVPEQEFSEVPGSDGESVIDSGQAGFKYDWTQAPDKAKAPPRVDLDGKEVTITAADVIMPPMSQAWQLTRGGDKEFKYCQFVLYFDVDGQQEFYSGVRTFKRAENPAKPYSHPTITRDRKSQASKLVGLYADFKKKDINEVSMKEFMAFLNSKPKATISANEVENPVTHDMIKKNFIGKFI